MRQIALALAFVALLGAGSSACKACSRSGHIAEVSKHSGDLKRDTAATKEHWEAASDGAQLAIGDALRTGPGATAVVRLTGGGSVGVASDTTIRFLAAAPSGKNPGGAKLAVEAGEASIEAGDTELALETSIGIARIEPGGTLKLSPGGNGTRVEVTVGAARLDTESGGVALVPGKAFEVSLGGAIVERDEKAAADAGKPAEPVAEAAVDAGPEEVSLVVHGAGVRVQRKGSAWKGVADGVAAVSAGDTVDVPAGASVDVQRGARRGRLVGQGRFVVGDAGGALVRATGGRIELDATSVDVPIDVPGGSIVAKAGSSEGRSRVAAEVRPTETRVSVSQGQAEVRGSGAAETLRAGENATLSAKGGVAAMRGVERTDFTIRAGDSIIVRDPKPPTALGFDVAAVCPGAAVVSRGDGAAAVRGERKVGMMLPAGHHDYQVRCIGPDGLTEKPAVTGAITVVADAAKAELARLPPSTVVDMDGRRYTVLYQNLLPVVVARWADAPPGKTYTLVAGKDRIRADGAKHSLKSGSLGEGTHTLWFEVEDGSKKSAETTLVIKFDNAAPAASVTEPADGSFAPGDTVKVAGVVVEGWTVTVNGQSAALDAQKRFSTTATVPPGENAIVLRLSHPKRGTVYYVRHAR